MSVAEAAAARALTARLHLSEAEKSGAFAARMAAPRGYDPNRFTQLFQGSRGALFYKHLATNKKVYLTKSQKERCIRTPRDAPVSLLPGDVNNACSYVEEDMSARGRRHAHRRFDAAKGRWIRGYGGATIVANVAGPDDDGDIVIDA